MNYNLIFLLRCY